jgi:ferredoxin-NADP reductase
VHVRTAVATTSATATVPMRLHRIEHLAERCCEYEFRPLAGDALPPAPAGAHVRVHLPDGLERAYSVTNPDDRVARYCVAVKRLHDSRGGSRWLHERARVGMVIPVTGPIDGFPLHESAPHSVLFAGGIGITPLWSMVQRLEALGASWSLDYGVAGPEHLAFDASLRRFGDRVNHIVGGGDRPAVIDFAARIAASPAGSHFYCCGPAAMIDAFRAATAHLPPHHCHVESFAPAAAPALAGGFVVRLSRSGVDVAVPAGSTVLDALLAAGHDPPHGCSQGVCGTCETVVLEGEPDHRDTVLTPEERASNRTMMICCSGSRGPRLVLDL